MRSPHITGTLLTASGPVTDPTGGTIAGQVYYRGFTMKETGGAVATALIRAGGEAGRVIEQVNLAANESASLHLELEECEVSRTGGLYFTLLTGAISCGVRFSQ